jgi:hypothetical protein
MLQAASNLLPQDITGVEMKIFSSLNGAQQEAICEELLVCDGIVAVGIFHIKVNYSKPTFSYFNIMLMKQLSPPHLTQKSRIRIVYRSWEVSYLYLCHIKMYHPMEHIAVAEVIVLFKGKLF